ncbi:MAG: hypothetical protein O3A29_13375 [Planctomycetota bacterium]|nr:hypothetical protein [Planctomycetota bacterium]
MMKASRILYMSFCIVPLVVSFAQAEDGAVAPVAPGATDAVAVNDSAATETPEVAADGKVEGTDTDCVDCCCGLARLWGRWRCRDGCGRICWTTTGDMHQHYPYFPRYHGYYYYRPYNYIHVLEHQYQALSLGGDPRAPYQNRQFERVYERHAAARYDEADSTTYIIPLLRDASTPLPDLQDILETTP